MKLLVCSLLFYFPILLPAEPARGVEAVTIRAGYLRGLLPSLTKVHRDLQNAQTNAEQKFAVNKALKWSFLFTRNELPRRQIDINHKSVVRTGFEALERISKRSYTSRNKIYGDINAIDPTYLEIKKVIERMYALVHEEATNPDLVDTGLSIYNESVALSLKFTLDFFSSYSEYPMYISHDSRQFVMDITWIQRNLSDVEKHLLEYKFNLPELFNNYRTLIQQLESVKKVCPDGPQPIFFGKEEYTQKLSAANLEYRRFLNEFYSKLNRPRKSCAAISNGS